MRATAAAPNNTTGYTCARISRRCRCTPMQKVVKFFVNFTCYRRHRGQRSSALF